MNPEFKPDLKISGNGEKPKLGYVKLFNGLPTSAIGSAENTVSCEEGCFDPCDRDPCFDPCDRDPCFDPCDRDPCFDPR